MRPYVLDGHTHTIASGHAYHTLLELAQAANKRGMKAICLTEHGPELPGAPVPVYFSNYRILPPVIENVRIYKGIEANIMDCTGTLDIPKRALPRMEVISASLHELCLKPSTKEKNTEAVLGAAENPNVDWLCHLGNPHYELDYEAILQAAKKYNKLIEINNGSFFIRKGSAQNCVRIARRCAELDIPIILGTDTHFCTDVGYFPYADRALDLADVPVELIINLDANRLPAYLKAKNRHFLTDPRPAVDDVFSDF
ncbi:MAG: phosphatase [Eubacteriaceae bacterium]|nr:phosphatase [Eubacteriaceae bacterium]